MKKRCTDKNSELYVNYGARGINVCDEWNDFINFYTWSIDNGYADNLTIDRIDVNGNYCPANCRWVSFSRQARNKRNTRYIDVFGEHMCIADAVEKYSNKISAGTVAKRIDKYGFSPERALMQPLGCSKGEIGLYISKYG